MLVVSVMETDTKLDALDPKHEEVSARMEHQRIRQAMASVLAKQATHLLERTRLEVRISCQAIHAKNSRHMLLDLIDFYEPTMVVVGSRGLGSLRGILLGSTSHYLVQKSSAPVMVARKRLKLPALPRGRGEVVESVKARHMRLDQASIEKLSSTADEDQEEEAKDEVQLKKEKNGSRVGEANKEEESSPDTEAEAEVVEAGGESAGKDTDAKAVASISPTTPTKTPPKPVDEATSSPPAASNPTLAVPNSNARSRPNPDPPPSRTPLSNAKPKPACRSKNAKRKLPNCTPKKTKSDTCLALMSLISIPIK